MQKQNILIYENFLSQLILNVNRIVIKVKYKMKSLNREMYDVNT